MYKKVGRPTIVKLKQIEIPLPDLETQHIIVAQIEQEQRMVRPNLQLIDIFEKKIQAKLAEIWGET
jgi:restriction endonuclease S subunit